MSKIILLLVLILFPILLYAQNYKDSKGGDILSITEELYGELDIDDPLKPLSKEAIDKIVTKFGILYGFPDITDISDIERKEEIKDSIINILREWNYPIWKLIKGGPFTEDDRGGFIDRIFFKIFPEIISLKASESFQYMLYTSLIKNLLADEEMQVMFPLTWRTIDRMDRVKITVSPKAISESFKTDLASLSKNFPAIFKLPKYKDLVNKHPQLLLFSGTSDFYKSIMNLEPIDKAIYKLLYNLSMAGNTSIYSNLHSSFILFSDLCKAFKSRTYEDVSTIKEELDRGDRFTLLLMGVFSAKNNDVFFISHQEIASSQRAYGDASNYVKTKASNVSVIVNELVANERIYEFKNYISKFADMYFDCKQTLDTIKILQYYGQPVEKEIYFDKVLDFFEYGFNPQNYNSTFDYYDKETEKFIELLKYYREIDDNVKKEKYFAALMNSLYVYEDICTIYLSADSTFKTCKNFFTTVKIVGELTSADNDEEIAKVLNRYIFSSVDAYTKKEMPFSININSYLGYYYGKESEKVTNQWTQNRGVLAPIGLEFSLGLKDWGSLGLLIPIFDVGAIMDFKLNNDSTETVPEIRFENIISPGVYFVYGLPKIPFSIGGGLQYSPQLGKITLEGKTVEPRKLRWNIFIAFDLPLLNLFKNAN